MVCCVVFVVQAANAAISVQTNILFIWPPHLQSRTRKIMWRFTSSGETTTHGRLFLISLPIVGSRITRNTSNRLTTTPNLPHRSWSDSPGHHPTIDRHLFWPSHG